MTEIEYLLTCLAEECAEIQQAVAKAQRFGLNNFRPGSSTTNGQDIMIEINDLLGVKEMLEDRNVLFYDDNTYKCIDNKKEKVTKYMELSKTLGFIKKED